MGISDNIQLIFHLLTMTPAESTASYL